MLTDKEIGLFCKMSEYIKKDIYKLIKILYTK